MSPEEVTNAYKTGLSDIHEQIENYKEALLKRGVPSGYWLSSILAKHEAAMKKQLGYDLDVASGKGNSSANGENSYHYPENYTEFYDSLASEFKKFCLKENNPHYDPSCFNEWYINCQRCVPTYELQRRGHDVTALPCLHGNDYLSMNPFSVWQNPQIIRCSGIGNYEIESLMKIWGDGARAQITVNWTPSQGHTFIAEQINGKTHYIDPQSGSENYNDWILSALPGYTKFCRIDNLKPASQIQDCYKEVKR